MSWKAICPTVEEAAEAVIALALVWFGLVGGLGEGLSHAHCYLLLLLLSFFLFIFQ